MATYEERVQAKMAEMIATKEEMEIIDEAKRRLAKAELQRMREDWIAYLIANPHPPTPEHVPIIEGLIKKQPLTPSSH